MSLDLTRSASECPHIQRARARKYDCNLVWHIAELEPDLWCLYSPDRRTEKCIGTLEEVIAAYRNRAPVIFTKHKLIKPKPKGFENVTFNI